MAHRRPTRAGLFTGWWTDLDGKKVRRIYRSEYPELYRLHRKYLCHALGVGMIGCHSTWHTPSPGAGPTGNSRPSE